MTSVPVSCSPHIESYGWLQPTGTAGLPAPRSAAPPEGMTFTESNTQGLLVSIDFLKSLLDLARNVVEAERTVSSGSQFPDLTPAGNSIRPPAAI